MTATLQKECHQQQAASTTPSKNEALSHGLYPLVHAHVTCMNGMLYFEDFASMEVELPELPDRLEQTNCCFVEACTWNKIYRSII